MTDTKDSNQPDAEAIVAEIRQSIKQAGGGCSCCDAGGDAGKPADLLSGLEGINSACVVGRVKSFGPLGLIRRMAHRVIGSLVGDINCFNSRVVGVLNRMATDVVSGEEEARRSREKVSRLEERVRRLEERVGK